MGMEARISAGCGFTHQESKGQRTPVACPRFASTSRAYSRCFAAAPRQHKPILIYMRQENLSGELITLNDVFLSKLAAFPWEIRHDTILWGVIIFGNKTKY